jgi:hypothetical protein
MKRYIIELIKMFVKILSASGAIYLIYHILFEDSSVNVGGFIGAFMGAFIVSAVRLKYKMDDEAEDDDEF